MRSSFIPSILALLLSQIAFAQRDLSGIPDKFLTAANKDTAYVRFQAELSSLIKKANGRTTYAAEATQLFARNKNMLERVNRQYRRQESMNRSGFKPKSTVRKINPELLKLTASLSMVKFSQQFKKPYQGWGYCELANASTATLLKNDTQNGEVDFSIYPSSLWAPSFKEFHRGFRVTATVPDNPSIIAARVEFEYSFYYTGWDTYGASNGIQLVLGPSKNFNSPPLKASTDTAAFLLGYNISATRFNIMDILLPWDSISGEIAEVHVTKEGSITVEGYVKPKETIDFAIGAGYMQGSVYGINGHYLYGEFRLKKATITYLKTLGN